MSLDPSRRLDGERTAIRAYTLRDVDERAALAAANREQTAPWDPIRPYDWYDRPGQERELRADLAGWERGRAYAFAVVGLEDERIIGRVSLANVVRGPWGNATMGWWIAARHTRRGHGTEAVRLALDFAFGHLGLHRVAPAIIPRNEASAALARRVGFRLEGRALRYLQIRGVWEDHDLYAMTAEERPAPHYP